AQATAVAQSLMSGQRSALLLGLAAEQHPHATALLQLANFVAQHTGARVGFLGVRPTAWVPSWWARSPARVA
ncbi:MAG: hypothetical protein ACKOCU_01645, partial [Betaproteobacteria bacterium]